MKIFHMRTYRRALVALLMALAIGASVAPQAADFLSAAQDTDVQLAGSTPKSFGRESS